MLLRNPVEMFDYIWRGFAREGWIMIHGVSNNAIGRPSSTPFPSGTVLVLIYHAYNNDQAPSSPFNSSSPYFHYPFEIRPHLTHVQKFLDYCPTAARWPLSLVSNSSMAPINQRSREPMNRNSPDTMLWNNIQAMSFAGDGNLNNHFGWVLFFFH